MSTEKEYSRAPNFRGPRVPIGQRYHFAPQPGHCNAEWLAVGPHILLLLRSKINKAELESGDSYVIGTDQLKHSEWHTIEKCPHG